MGTALQKSGLPALAEFGPSWLGVVVLGHGHWPLLATDAAAQHFGSCARQLEPGGVPILRRMPFRIIDGRALGWTLAPPDAAVGQSSSNTYSSNGNAATSTNAEGDTVTTVFDAWGRPVSYSSTNYVDKRLYYQNETIQYDALGRVLGVFQQAGFPGASSGTETTQHVMAYDALTGQAIQENQGIANTAAAVYAQYVYGPDGHMILRDRNNNGGAGLDERLYVATAPDGSVVAIMNGSGRVVERYVYDGLGNVQALDPTGAPYGVSSGVYSGIPEDQLGQQYSGSTFSTSTNLITNTGTAFDWNYFYQGQRYDGIAGVYGSGAQTFNPRQQSLLTPDLAAIQAGISAYDPTGGATGANLIGEEFANGVSGIGAALAPDFGSGVGSFAGPGSARKSDRSSIRRSLPRSRLGSTGWPIWPTHGGPARLRTGRWAWARWGSSWVVCPTRWRRLPIRWARCGI